MLLLAFSFCICTVPKFGAADVAQQPGSISAWFNTAHAFPGISPEAGRSDSWQTAFRTGSNSTTSGRIALLRVD